MRLSHAAGIVAVVALALRLAFLAEARHFPTFESPLVDAFVYDRDARAVAAGGPGAMELPYYQPPGYPMLLGAVYAVTGGSWLAPRVLQAAAGALTAALVFLLAARTGGTRAGWIGGLLMAAHLPALYFEGELLPPAWILLLETAALLLLAEADRSGDTRRRPVIAALLLGLSAVLRPTALLLAAGAGVWWLRGTGRPRSRRPPARHAALALAALALPILPFASANVIGGKEPVAISWNGGINFYVGNGAGSDSLTAIQPGFAWDRLQREPLRDGVRPGGGESRYWFRRGVREAAADPAAWAAALGRKTLRFLDRRETPRNTDWEAFRPLSRVLSLPLPGFGILAPLALLGFAARGADRRLRSLLLIAVAAVAVENLLFFVAGRYRLQAVPALAAMAGVGAASLMAAPRRIPRAALIAAALLALVTQWDFLGERDVDEARAALNRGVALRRAGDVDGAAREFEAALSADPADPDAHRWRGEVALTREDPRRALLHFDEALAGAPDYVRVLLGKAAALERLGRAAEAEPAYRDAVKADPWSTDARLNYGVWLAVAGRADEARHQFEEGIRINPSDGRLRRNLDRLLGGS
ncbi:MAG TPA: tetratricopeptide repeat protein [bacterium]|nr:tetratricopeptide repeat protein [bacterium]